MAATDVELERLYHDRFAGFVGALGAVLGDGHLAEECVQAAFVRALASAASFRGGSLAAWVWRIAVNGAVDARRRELRLGSLDSAPWDALADVPAHGLPELGDPAVRSALMTLSPRRRLVVFLRYHGDLTQREIAEVLGTSEGTIAATLAQARGALRTALQPTEVGGLR
jgi:RNA polymerase sigma-70 factor (ECF subfamily)